LREFHPDERSSLVVEPNKFFMTIRDIAFWLRSARMDATLAKLRATAEPAQAFDQLYSATEDPYGASLSQFRYQRQKYETLLSMLPKRQYRHVLDIGCGRGAFTRRLAAYGDEVLGIDISLEAVQQARTLSTDFKNLEFAQADVLDFQNDGRQFDLIVVADILYYLSPLTDFTLKSLAKKITSLLAPGGLLLLVNHSFFTLDQASRTTRRIHDAFRWSPDLGLVAEHKRAFYLTSIFEGQRGPALPELGTDAADAGRG
jgi:2-polyprenyl-3-methyl-5-hydroxy-6-metoxy-1,4-benzoquinol methylase